MCLPCPLSLPVQKAPHSVAISSVGLVCWPRTCLRRLALNLCAPQRRATEAPGHEAPARNFGYRGVIHGLRSVAATDGMLGLWRGLLPRLVLKSVGSSLWYTVYMGCRRHLSDEPS